MRTTTTAILILLLASHPAQAGAPQTVAIGVDTSNLDPNIAAEIQDSIPVYAWNGFRDGLSKAARTKVQLIPISEAKIAGQIRNCDSETCLQDVAQNESVDLVVRVKVQAKKASKKRKPEYVVSLIVVRSLPTRDAWQDKSDCKDCGSSEINHMASLVAGSIAEKIKIDVPPPLAPVPLPPVMAVAPAAPPPALFLGPPSPAKPEQEAWSVPRYLSGSVLGAGLVLAGVGGYLLHLNGQGTCDLAAAEKLCTRTYDTGAVGAGLIVGGSLVALGGLAGLLFFGPDAGSTHVALGITASSISIAGGF